MIAEWKEEMEQLQVPHSQGFSLIETMGDPMQIRQWNIQGLPTDSVSINNAILVTRGSRWPLMLDP